MTQHSLTNGLGSIPIRDAQMYKIGCLLSAVGTMAIANDGFVLYLGQNKRNTYPLEQREKKKPTKEHPKFIQRPWSGLPCSLQKSLQREGSRVSEATNLQGKREQKRRRRGGRLQKWEGKCPCGNDLTDGRGKGQGTFGRLESAEKALSLAENSQAQEAHPLLQKSETIPPQGSRTRAWGLLCA